ncbi:crotonase/enoyl-CoA hydratase family protein [Frankia sp. CNm7]|uniref:Crotonase/enoyl-CoA hydratase family protein n=1 Tax=Frankia nepalensis TaxID=1836974 RepID=A0A937UQR8_9ACTN|nr:crotonase/enoyl-CoA hydratase family protein [Frankia nepalensis]MBL7500869.1 crotonase/enoyl-CoA hydratase family protein [Frankia nepalensis]MBL7509235.1 crotonase/enoyl-CoA hydratase family protein [Frankia nepalensis]MBL7517306.1 crotonase/enoyl-CoA hydratase family protein [Frankia nepalensis]MBL7627001.1 crotonase/enoyl-CoA hydratase family protein [Frankia nepalensis]
MAERVLVEIQDGVADVRLNRPEKLNALDGPMYQALVDACAAIGEQPAVRAVVLSGAGRGFCAGLDMAAFQTMAGDRAASSALAERVLAAGKGMNIGQLAVSAWSRLPVPVIAAIHGPCLGGGLQLALGADVRIVAPDASMAVLEIRWGLVPDMGGSLALAQLVRPDVAMELAWTGRVVGGVEAVELGLATRSAPDPLSAARELATQIASMSPDAIRAVKRLLSGTAHRTPTEQMALERQESGALVGTPNQVEAVTAAFEKRAPIFRASS